MIEPEPPVESPTRTRTLLEAMREAAEIGVVETSDDFYCTLHKLDLKALLDMFDANRAEKAAAEAMRERAAKICDDESQEFAYSYSKVTRQHALKLAAAAIRALKV